jgi:SWI/SNF-related matrix-associated actin-dependent regulator 1 of chromatin subfamily A
VNAAPEQPAVAEQPATERPLEVRLYGARIVVLRSVKRDPELAEQLAKLGARFDELAKEWRLPRVKAPEALRTLEDAGYILHPGPIVRFFLQAAKEREYLDQQAAEAPAESYETALAKTGAPPLFAYQKIAVEWLRTRDKALLCDEPGLGKTREALLALPRENRSRQEKPPPVLVVCPKIAKHVWDREARRDRPDLRPYMLEGQGSFRWPEPGEIVIVNYDILPDRGDIHTPPPTGCIVIADEAHYLKTMRTQRTLRFKGLSEWTRQDRGWTWLLTGTPLLSHPLDLWSLCSCAGLAAETWGQLKQFKDLFGMVTKPCACRQCGHKEPAKDDSGRCPVKKDKKSKKACDCDNHVTEATEWGTPGPEVSERFNKIALRRLRTEVLPDLPGKQYEDIAVILAAALKADIDEELPEGWEDAIDHAIETQSGVNFTEMSGARAALAEAKIPAMLEFIDSYEEQDTPLLVFSAHTAPLEVLAERPGWELITGQVNASSKDRKRIEDDFQAGKLKGLALNIKAGGTALTLTYAHHALFVDQEWNPGDNIQAEDRLVRIGQKSGVMIHRLVADHRLDQRLAEILDKKTKMIVGSLGK